MLNDLSNSVRSARSGNEDEPERMSGFEAIFECSARTFGDSHEWSLVTSSGSGSTYLVSLDRLPSFIVWATSSFSAQSWWSRSAKEFTA